MACLAWSFHESQIISACQEKTDAGAGAVGAPSKLKRSLFCADARTASVSFAARIDWPVDIMVVASAKHQATTA
jgi:hypothetical protein